MLLFYCYFLKFIIVDINRIQSNYPSNVQTIYFVTINRKPRTSRSNCAILISSNSSSLYQLLWPTSDILVSGFISSLNQTDWSLLWSLVTMLLKLLPNLSWYLASPNNSNMGDNLVLFRSSGLSFPTWKWESSAKCTIWKG